jgi:hypothetical protein
MRRFHLAMEGVASLLDGAETGIRMMINQRNEWEAAMYGSSDGHH